MMRVPRRGFWDPLLSGITASSILWTSRLGSFILVDLSVLNKNRLIRVFHQYKSRQKAIPDFILEKVKECSKLVKIVCFLQTV